jgi:hypothetical protein
MNRQRIAAFFWTLLLAAFVVLGICSVAPRLDLRPPRIGAPLAGIDGSFGKLLSVPDGSRRILEVAEKIKPGAPVLVVGPGDGIALFDMFHSISYLLWPRAVWEHGQVGQGIKPRFGDLMPAQPLKPAAMFLFRLQPPPELSAKTKRIAPDLSAIQLPENE